MKGKQSIKLAIFDLDGTLVEFPYDYLFAETERILAEYHYPAVERSILASCFADFDYFRFVEEERREEFAGLFWKSFDYPNYPKAVPLAGAVEVLRYLAQRGVGAAIATARVTPEPELKKELEKTGLMNHISLIAPRQSSEQYWSDKKGQIQLICDTFGVPPSETMMVGDIPPDVETAKKAGVGFTVAVLSGGIKAEVLRQAKPNLLLPDINSLIDQLPSSLVVNT